jgi:SOS-response transcriptional repressor LexA
MKKTKITFKKLDFLIKNKGISYADFSRLIGITTQRLNNWKKRGVVPNSMAQVLSHKLSITVDALFDEALWSEDNKDIEVIITPKIINKPVPLVSFVAAGAFNENTEPYPMGCADEYYPCPTKHSESTFALKVQGLSMYPEFSPDEIIFVDPEVEATNGSFVVVRQNNDNEATFKQLRIMGGSKFLQAVNQTMPDLIEMMPDANICGVVIGSYKER